MNLFNHTHTDTTCEKQMMIYQLFYHTLPPFESKKKKTATVNTAFVIPLDKANKQLYNYDNKQTNKTKLKPT